MKLYNVTSKLEKELEAIDLTELNVDELQSLGIDIQTDFINGELENEIIATDAFMQIISEIASRYE